MTRSHGHRWAAGTGALVVVALLASACGPAAATRVKPAGAGHPTPTGDENTGLAVAERISARVAPPVRRLTRAPAGLVPLRAPAALAPFATPAVAGEGRWHQAGRLVRGHVAVFETVLRPPGSNYEAGIAWMDPRLLRAQLYSGSVSPGHGPWRLTAPISPAAARSVVAAFNGGFKFPASQGGYYSEGRLVYPLRPGGASLVIYRNGDATVGSWGRDVKMTPRVAAVRQNLTLLVDGGRPVTGLNPNDTYLWGSTLGGVPAVWRSGVGVTASGALVYVTGPYLEVTQLAALLARAGCVRAMTLDMNPDWTVLATYKPSGQQLAAPGDGSALLPGMVQGPYTFFEPWWARDFVTLSAR